MSVLLLRIRLVASGGRVEVTSLPKIGRAGAGGKSFREVVA